MNELTEKFREEFKDKETRRIYVDDFLNAQIATQIKVLREQRGLTQAQLAELAGMRQERISVLEDIDYSSWTISVLRRLAEAFDLRLSLKFETFGSYLYEFENLNRDALERVSFDEDPVFHQLPEIGSTAAFEVDIVASYSAVLNEVIKDAVKEAVAKAVFEQRPEALKPASIHVTDLEGYTADDETILDEYVSGKMFASDLVIDHTSELAN